MDIEKTTLWKMQYLPRERKLKKRLNKIALRKWNRLNVYQKIAVIDRLKNKGIIE